MKNKKTNLSKLSENEFSELNCLIGSIEALTERDFIHVRDFIPKYLSNALDKIRKDIEAEFERRDALYYE